MTTSSVSKNPGEGSVGVFDQVGIDVSDLDRSARFWAAVLGLKVAGKSGAYLEFERAVGAPRVYLQKVPEKKTSKSRVHLDVKCKDVDAARARVEGLGGRMLAQYTEGGAKWFVMGDPDGNEFCLTH